MARRSRGPRLDLRACRTLLKGKDLDLTLQSAGRLILRGERGADRRRAGGRTRRSSSRIALFQVIDAILTGLSRSS